MDEFTAALEARKKNITLLWIYLFVLVGLAGIMISQRPGSRPSTEHFVETIVEEDPAIASSLNQQVSEAIAETEINAADSLSEVPIEEAKDMVADTGAFEPISEPTETEASEKTWSVEPTPALTSASEELVFNDTPESFESAPIEEIPLETETEDSAKTEISSTEEIVEETPSSGIPYGVSKVLNSSEESDPLKICQMQEWDVQFNCDLTWEVLDKTKDNLQLVVSKDPLVTLSWKKFDQEFRYMNQLSPVYFKQTNIYQDGFQTEKVNFSGHDAILVKGLSRMDSDIQMRDYYYLHNNKLVGVFFRISPSSKWEDGKLIIKRVKDSFAKL